MQGKNEVLGGKRTICRLSKGVGMFKNPYAGHKKSGVRVLINIQDTRCLVGTCGASDVCHTHDTDAADAYLNFLWFRLWEPIYMREKTLQF